MGFISFSTILLRKEYLAKNEQPSQPRWSEAPRGAGPNADASVASA